VLTMRCGRPYRSERPKRNGSKVVQTADCAPAKSLICRVSSVVEQRFCKPLVGSSNLSPGTTFHAQATRQNPTYYRFARFPCPVVALGLPGLFAP
jgi:hypothetical protein